MYSSDHEIKMLWEPDRMELIFDAKQQFNGHLDKKV